MEELAAAVGAAHTAHAWGPIVLNRAARAAGLAELGYAGHATPAAWHTTGGEVASM